MSARFEMRVGGGYALVNAESRQRFDVASITPEALPHKRHRLVVRLASGDATSDPPFPDQLEPGRDPNFVGLDLNARNARMEIWPNQRLPRPQRVVAPSPEDLRDLVPDVPELGRSQLASDWLRRIEARITMRTGLLAVDRNELAVGEFEFRHPTKAPKSKQRMMHGLRGLIYSIDADTLDSVLLALYPLDTPDEAIVSGTITPTDTYVLRPGPTGLIQLLVDSLEEGQPMVSGMDLREFSIFYRLLEAPTPVERQWIPRWTALGQPVSPGSECPPGYYDDLTA